MSQFIFIAKHEKEEKRWVDVYMNTNWEAYKSQDQCEMIAAKATAGWLRKIEEFFNILFSWRCGRMWEWKFIDIKRIKILSQLKIGISLGKIECCMWFNGVNPNILLWLYCQCQKCWRELMERRQVKEINLKMKLFCNKNIKAFLIKLLSKFSFLN